MSNVSIQVCTGNFPFTVFQATFKPQEEKWEAYEKASLLFFTSILLGSDVLS